jgi:hypothetical protein
LWDSGIHATGWAFTNTFDTAGTYGYRCNVHSAQKGTVLVQGAPNSPPTIVITAPANGAVFSAPWSGSIRGTVADSDGTVSKIDFSAGSTSIGTASSPAGSFSFPLTNLPAGNFSLRAVATDNLGATNSSTVTVTVLAPVDVVLSSPERTSASNFQFIYTATPGLRYIVSRSVDLPVWLPLATNTATGGSVLFQDKSATDAFNFYSVRLAPNP